MVFFFVWLVVLRFITLCRYHAYKVFLFFIEVITLVYNMTLNFLCTTLYFYFCIRYSVNKPNQKGSYREQSSGVLFCFLNSSYFNFSFRLVLFLI